MLALLLAVGCAFVARRPDAANVVMQSMTAETKGQAAQGQATQGQGQSQEKGNGQGTQTDSDGDNTIPIPKGQVYKGNLVLVNRDHPIREEEAPTDIVKLFEHKELIDGFALLDNTIRLSERLAKSFGAMAEAAEKDGVSHFMISSGYRDEAEQREMYEQKGAEYALPPGRSEHNLGLSLDVGSTLKEIDKAPEGAWLKKNAWSYGFILRYPKDKTSVTGIRYEPWHFRYVGLPHSMIMKNKKFTLEEYLAYLQEKKTVKVTVLGKRYQIIYSPVSDGDQSLRVPEHRSYELSGDNVGGVIVTLRL